MQKLKDIFASYGMPDSVVSDGGPQFTSDPFKTFSKTWNFNHIISSPRYPQSNGMAERHIQTVKKMLLKVVENNKDISLSLLQYRNMPPAQLLMGRNVRTHIPVHQNQLKPSKIKYRKFNKYISIKQQKTTEYFNKKHGVRGLSHLQPGTAVFGQKLPNRNNWTERTILKHLKNRIYLIQLIKGAS